MGGSGGHRRQPCMVWNVQQSGAGGQGHSWQRQQYAYACGNRGINNKYGKEHFKCGRRSGTGICPLRHTTGKYQFPAGRAGGLVTKIVH